MFGLVTGVVKGLWAVTSKDCGIGSRVRNHSWFLADEWRKVENFLPNCLSATTIRARRTQQPSLFLADRLAEPEQVPFPDPLTTAVALVLLLISCSLPFSCLIERSLSRVAPGDGFGLSSLWFHLTLVLLMGIELNYMLVFCCMVRIWFLVKIVALKGSFPIPLNKCCL
ncbi:pre-miRNA 5'-monophosphate methyltransferase [Platysternon megacephalum]|uniref:Pre-miRNA 5'-monophosphate methyltransferase n=1 Tax=Platysternon megacephalum TaxID=55544 RepID=A0A4D9EA44_9SAUR|nr:pre-miRNA 5'-monophosphate methyltransferase [Platysternon megacephalum]